MEEEGCVPRMEAAFPICTATGRFSCSFGYPLPVVAWSLQSDSLRKIRGKGLSTPGPDDSMAVGICLGVPPNKTRPDLFGP